MLALSSRAHTWLARVQLLLLALALTCTWWCACAAAALAALARFTHATHPAHLRAFPEFPHARAFVETSSAMPPHPDQRFCFHIALKHDAAQVHQLQSALERVSDPQHASYGAYLSIDEVRDIVGAPSHHLNALVEWLHEQLAPIDVRLTPLANEPHDEQELEQQHDRRPHIRVVQTGDTVHVCTTVQRTEQLFQTSLRHYHHARHPTARGIRASSPLVVPPHLVDAIEFVGALNTPLHSSRIHVHRRRRAAAHDASHDCHCLDRNVDEHESVSRRASIRLASLAARGQPWSVAAVDRLPTTVDPVSSSIGSLSAPTTPILPPLILNLTGGYEEIHIVWNVYCANGELNRDLAPLPPCSTARRSSASTAAEPTAAADVTPDEPIIVSSFQFVLTTASSIEPHFSLYSHSSERRRQDLIIPVLNDRCNGRHCVVTLPVRNYVGYHVQILVVYSDGRTALSCLSAAVFASDFATPTFLRSLYDIPPGLQVKHPGATQSVAEFTEQYYNQEDLDRYLALMGVPQQTVTSVVGFNDPAQGTLDGGESQLDLQVIMGVAVRAPTVFWSVAGREPDNAEEPFLRWLTEISDFANPPLVHSVSYGDIEDDLPLHYMNRINVEFMKMGVRGMTVLVASGDGGVASDVDPDDPMSCAVTHPEFPTSSPWVTSVGATQMSARHSPICAEKWRGMDLTCSVPREVVCSASTGGVITSGGGFSHRFARPAYQNDAVHAYLTQTQVPLPPRTHFNASGRAYPDISGYGTRYPVLMGKDILPTAGTSASTPLIAAIVTLLNDVRLSTGQPPLGFLNPLLYFVARKYPETLNDVVFGDNKCSYRDVPCCEHGFAATPGWDAVTGVGTPRFSTFATLLHSGLRSTEYAYLGRNAQADEQQVSTTERLSLVAFSMSTVGLVVALVVGAIVVLRGTQWWWSPQRAREQLQTDYGAIDELGSERERAALLG